MEEQKQRRLRPGAFLWGRQRIRAGISIRELEGKTGIFRGFLSRMENGSMIPTAEEYDAVLKALGISEPTG